MIIDLHSHTRYSNCGRDEPRALVEEMIRHGVNVLGITDHNYGIADRREEYVATVLALKEKYKAKIKILCGIEMSTMPFHGYGNAPGRQFDYCIIEHLSDEQSVMKGDIINYISEYGCPVGIAHTDIFGFARKCGWRAEEYIGALARAGVFWELNVNFDSIHGYREHDYVKQFFQSEEQQAIVKRSGLYIGVGFDGHRIEDYDVDRVATANKFILDNGFKHAIDLIVK